MNRINESLTRGECDNLTFWADHTSFWFRAVHVSLTTQSVYSPYVRLLVDSFDDARLGLQRAARVLS